MVPIRGSSTLEVLKMVTFLLVQMTKHFTNKTLQSPSSTQSDDVGEEKEGRQEHWGVVGRDKEPLQSIKEKNVAIRLATAHN